MSDYFNSNIPSPVQFKATQLAEQLKEFIDGLVGDTFGNDPTIEGIEYKRREGFISSNDGGISICQSYYCGNNSGIYPTTKEREFIEVCSNDAYEQFKRDIGIDEVSEDMREEYYEYEQAWLEDCYTIIEARIWISKDDAKVNLELLAHYQDTPYMRDKYAESILCRRITQEEFLALDDGEIMKLFHDAYLGA